MNIAEVIKQKRQKRNITQTELAELLNVTPQAVSRWEMGISYPDIAMVPRISEVLAVSADELLGINPLAPAPAQTANGDEPPLNQSEVDSIFDYIPKETMEKGKKVLVVDDSDFMRMMLEDILTRRGEHTVLQAKNGQECLDMLEKEEIDVCVLDIVMPVMHGIEALRRIKERWPEKKVVMLSALCGESNVKQALALGAEAFVVKPFQAECLVERVG